MTEFSGTPSRKKINDLVAEHLYEALTWCTPNACAKNRFDMIRNANTHDEMVAAAKKICLNIWKIK
jgi:hypothetical protein